MFMSPCGFLLKHCLFCSNSEFHLKLGFSFSVSIHFSLNRGHSNISSTYLVLKKIMLKSMLNII